MSKNSISGSGKLVPDDSRRQLLFNLFPPDLLLCLWQHLAPEPVFVNDYTAQKSIQLAYVAWRAGTTNRVVVPARQAKNRFLGSLKGLQIQALNHREENPTLLISQHFLVVILRARLWCTPLTSPLVTAVYLVKYERWMDSNSERRHSDQAIYQPSHPLFALLCRAVN